MNKKSKESPEQVWRVSTGHSGIVVGSVVSVVESIARGATECERRAGSHPYVAPFYEK